MLHQKALWLFILFVGGIIAADNEWPNPYGSDYSSNSPTTLLRPPLKLKWVSRVFDNFKGGPVVAEGKVVCMGRTGNLFCLDAETGALLWRFSIKRNLIPGDWMGRSDFGSRQVPLIWQGKVYANLFWHGYPEISGIHCFDLQTGNLLWRRLTGYAKSRYSPNIVDGRIVYLSNLNISTGGTAVYQLHVQAWDAVTGDSLWIYALKTTAADAGCWQIAIHDTIFALTGAGTGKTVALDKNGNMLWQDTAHSGGMIVMSYYRGKLFLGGSAANTVLLNASDGSFIRSDATPGYLVPVFTGDRYWRRGYGDSPIGYNVNTGVKELSCQYTASVTGCGSPTAANGYLYLGHGNTFGAAHATLGHVLRAYDIVTGKVVWNYRMSSNVCTAPAIAYDRLYITAGGNGDLVYCFENE
jgi:outer membrane protein assembly factor BamB